MATVAVPGTLATRKPFWSGALRLVRRNPALVFGALLVAAIVVLAFIGPSIAPYDPLAQNYRARLQPPSSAHWLGTDKFGRDVFSRILYATRIDLAIGVISVIFPFIFGFAVGAIAGYYGKLTDNVLMRVVDISVAFPFYVLVISILAVLGPGIRNMFIALILVGWMAYAKIIRGEVLIAKNHEYVLAAKAMGYSDGRIMFRHLLPNVITPAIIFAMSDIVMCILAGASLGFLGLGVQAPTPEWGGMIADAREYITTEPWLSISPGVAIAIVGISFSMFGDGISVLLGRRQR